MNFSRRTFMTRLGLLASATFLMRPALTRAADCQRASGSGSYALGPFEPVTAGDEPAYLITDLGFDETMIFCKVTTNFAPFKFPTARLGVIDLSAHEFFMDMQSESIDSLTVEEGSDGPVAS